MAFIFVPNADGSFTEGDKQTNPDTGVEYCYVDGAWRALGPKIEDEFDTLDDRYVRLNATSVVGDLYRLRGPNAAGTGLSSFQNISGGEQRLYNIALAENSNTGWAASVQYVQNYVGTQIDAIPDVNLDGYATEDYVDNAIRNIDLSAYLPLSGGTLTGTLTSNHTSNQRINFLTNGSSANCDISRNGTWQFSIQDGKTKVATEIDMTDNKIINVATPANGKDAVNKAYLEEYVNTNAASGDFLPLSGGTLTGTLTGQLIKSIRNTGYAIEIKPNDGPDTKAFIRNDGTSRLATLTVESPLAAASERPFEIKGRLSDGSTVSKDFFYAYANSNGTASAMNYNGKMNSTNNLVNYGFVTNKVPGRFYVQNGSLYYES